MGFLDKMKNKIENRVGDAIVDKMFGKQKQDAENEVIRQQQAVIEEQQRQLAEQQAAQAAQAAQPAEPQVVYVNTGAPAQASGRIPDAAEMERLMGMAYNTKRCPSCQAVCMNSPVECPYCHADLRGVKPMTPEELEALE